MDEGKHVQSIVRYFEKSKPVSDLLLHGLKHLGYHPKNKKVSEKEAQLLMQELVGKKLQLSKSMRVLDAGCGEGGVSTYLARKHQCSIEGITLVPFEVERANTLARKLGVSEMVNYQVMDYSNTAFKDDHFDAIYTIETLVHSPDIRRTFKEFYRILRKGGRVAFFEYSIAEDGEFSSYELNILDMVIKSAGGFGLKDFRHNRCPQLLKESGFEKIMAEDITENVAPSVYRLKRFFIIPYFFAKVFHLQEKYVNLTGVIEFSKMGEKGLVRYNVFSAEK